MATERGAEGTRGAVTDAFGDLRDSEIAAMEEILRHSHVFASSSALRSASADTWCSAYL